MNLTSKYPLLGLVTLVTGCLLTTGCATTGHITPQYVAPSAYQSFDCNSLNQEYRRINSYVSQVGKQSSSITTTGVGIGISAGRWGISPNINIGLGKSNQSQGQDTKLSKLFGERDAVIQSARIKKCAFADSLKTYGEK